MKINEVSQPERLDEFVQLAAFFAGDLAAGVGKVGSAIAKKLGANTEAFDQKLDSFIDNWTVTGLATSLYKNLTANGMDDEKAKEAAESMAKAEGDDDTKKKAMAVVLAGLKKNPQAVVSAMNNDNSGGISQNAMALLKAASNLGESRLNEQRLDEFAGAIMTYMVGALSRGMLRKGAQIGGEKVAEKLPTLLGKVLGKKGAEKAGSMVGTATQKAAAGYDAVMKQATLVGNGNSGRVLWAGKTYATNELGQKVIDQFKSSPEGQKFDQASPQDRQQALNYALAKGKVDDAKRKDVLGGLGTEVFQGGTENNLMLAMIMKAALSGAL